MEIRKTDRRYYGLSGRHDQQDVGPLETSNFDLQAPPVRIWKQRFSGRTKNYRDTSQHPLLPVLLRSRNSELFRRS